MKILHEELVDLLAGSLGIEKKEATEALSAWVDAIDKETDEHGSYHAEGLGTFRKEDGKLQFLPDEKLSLEANHKFAGMSPIEVSPTQSWKPEEPDLDVEEQEEPVELEGSEATGVPADQEKQKDLDQEEDSEEPIGKTEEETIEDFEEEPLEEKAVEDEVEELVEEPEEDAHASYKPGEIRPLGVSRRSRTGSPEEASEASKDDRRKSSVSDKLIWLVPVAAIVIAAILLFFHFDGLRLDRKHAEGPAVVQEQIPVPVPDEEQEEESVEHEIAPSVDPADEIAREDEGYPLDPVADAASAPADEVVAGMSLPYGLEGPEDEVLIGAYTIVLHSVRNERKSEIEKKRLEDQGYKATRWSAELSSGRTTWRVGVGQFKNVSDAEQAVEELPEPYRSNNFIIRIR